MAAEVEGMVDQMPGLAAAEPAKEERGAESAIRRKWRRLLQRERRKRGPS